MDKNIIYNEDCLVTMGRWLTGSIDLTVTSPPYDKLRKYNGYSFDFQNVAKSLFRVTKNGGVLVWVIGDETVDGDETGTSFRHALYLKEVGFRLHDTMIFSKPQYPPNCLRQSRYAQVFEYMFVFTKNGQPKTFNRIMRKNKTAGQSMGKPRDIVQRDGVRRTYGSGRATITADETVKENIWSFSIGRASGGDTTKHPAPFPEQLANDHIISWSNEGDLVYDPFMGSGTTAKMAIKTNRNYIGSEISEEYCKIAEQRLTQEE